MFKIFADSQQGASQPLAFHSTVFPGGEVQVSVEVDAPAQALRLHAHLPDAQAVMSLLMLSDALRRAYPGRPLALHLPYVPYARQDRVANPGEALSAKVFCQLINAQGYSRVVIQDPHSDVVTALLDRVEVEDPLPALRRVLEQVGPAALVAPDAGARKRVLKLARELGCEAVLADKVRDTQSGRISGTQVTGLAGAAAIGGGRYLRRRPHFTELAKALRARQREQGLDAPLYLYVTHGIFSHGLEPLLAHYQQVFTRNDWTADARCQLV